MHIHICTYAWVDPGQPVLTGWVTKQYDPPRRNVEDFALNFLHKENVVSL